MFRTFVINLLEVVGFPGCVMLVVRDGIEKSGSGSLLFAASSTRCC